MGSDSNKEYSVNWKNHMSHVRDAFTHLRTSNELTDVTLYCEGQKIGAHKMLLSACSLYFRNTFKELDCQHPVIVMYGVEFCVLSNILQFIYNGEVNVDTTKLDSFLKVAQLLQICGLTDKPSEKRSNESETITEENPNEAFIETNPVPSSSEATSRGVKRIRTEEIEPVKEEVERPENDTLFITDSIKCEPTEVSRIDDPLEEADPLSHTDQSQDAIELFGSTNSQGIGDKEFKSINMEEDENIEDELERSDIIDSGFPRRIYDRSNHFENMDDFNFFRRFRITKSTTLELLGLIENELKYPTDRNQCVSPMNQLLTCLRYYATNGHLMTVADFSGMHTSTVSRIIVRVSGAIARLGRRFIKMPETQEQMNQTVYDFYAIAGFPRVIGVIDGTHVKILSPGGDDEENFRNKKNYFSINVQAVCNSHLQILNIVARWPGAAEDATIFSNSRLRTRFEAGNFKNYILLGDGEFPLKPYLFTPLVIPQTRGQQLYNEAHMSTRSCVERLFGVWKRRFPVLAYGIRLKLDTVLSVIVATAVLHNMAIARNEQEPPPPEAIDPAELEKFIAMGQIPNAGFPVEHPNAVNLRNTLVNNFFANLNQ